MKVHFEGQSMVITLDLEDRNALGSETKVVAGFAGPWSPGDRPLWTIAPGRMDKAGTKRGDFKCKISRSKT